MTSCGLHNCLEYLDAFTKMKCCMLFLSCKHSLLTMVNFIPDNNYCKFLQSVNFYLCKNLSNWQFHLIQMFSL